MSDVLLALVVILQAVLVVIFLIRKPAAPDLAPLVERIDASRREVLESSRAEAERDRADAQRAATSQRDELRKSQESFANAITAAVRATTEAQHAQLGAFATQLDALTRSLAESGGKQREELAKSFASTSEVLVKQLGEAAKQQRDQLEAFGRKLGEVVEVHERKSKELRESIEAQLGVVRADNAKQLEEMRRTVDEKLQGTLEKRLGESFKLVSERLEAVHKGLGEMQTLASGVGDLKKVLSNVKTRGIWGEVQLGNLLEQMLSSEQYATNVAVAGEGRETVEFAIKMPGGEEGGPPVWLPIDAKFPVEDYERLVDASERADVEGVEVAARALEVRVRGFAREIRDKYVRVPKTTEFAILFLPTEGLYAEILRRPGLAESMQRELRIVIAGPTTLAAILNSLQMGFRSLAIQKRSSEVWKVLGAVKADFGRFADVLESVKKKLDAASQTIETAQDRTRLIGKKLRKVEELPVSEANDLLGLPEVARDVDGEG